MLARAFGRLRFDLAVAALQLRARLTEPRGHDAADAVAAVIAAMAAHGMEVGAALLHGLGHEGVEEGAQRRIDVAVLRGEVALVIEAVIRRLPVGARHGRSQHAPRRAPARHAHDGLHVHRLVGVVRVRWIGGRAVRRSRLACWVDRTGGPAELVDGGAMQRLRFGGLRLDGRFVGHAHALARRIERTGVLRCVEALRAPDRTAIGVRGGSLHVCARPEGIRTAAAAGSSVRTRPRSRWCPSFRK